MGYSTSFSGAIQLSRQLKGFEKDAFNSFCSDRHDDNVGPGIWCDLEVSDDGQSIRWNGAEKTYELENWVPFVIARFLEPWGVVANGHLDANGERAGDIWQINVKDNVVTRVAGRITFEEVE